MIIVPEDSLCVNTAAELSPPVFRPISEGFRADLHILTDSDKRKVLALHDPSCCGKAAAEHLRHFLCVY